MIDDTNKTIFYYDSLAFIWVHKTVVDDLLESHGGEIGNYCGDLNGYAAVGSQWWWEIMY